jgi:two-component system, cell cycle response regulator DivK
LNRLTINLLASQRGGDKLPPFPVGVTNWQEFDRMLGTEPPRTAAKRILVVEDNELNLKLLNDILEAHGYDVLSTGEGAVAAAWARQYRPDLILMDLQLPDMSGLEVTQQLKADPETQSIPIVAVTAFAMAGDEKKALDHGCDAYVSKPFMIKDVLDRIADFIGTPDTPSRGDAANRR